MSPLASQLQWTLVPTELNSRRNFFTIDGFLFGLTYLKIFQFDDTCAPRQKEWLFIFFRFLYLEIVFDKLKKVNDFLQ